MGNKVMTDERILMVKRDAELRIVAIFIKRVVRYYNPGIAILYISNI